MSLKSGAILSKNAQEVVNLEKFFCTKTIFLIRIYIFDAMLHCFLINFYIEEKNKTALKLIEE
jgi:hypothetical protein